MLRMEVPKATGFDWDTGNELKSVARHGVTVSEAEEIFFSGPFVQGDVAHSTAEARFHAFGETAGGRKIVAVFTMRGSRIRIISARDMSRRERTIYGQALKEDTRIP